MHSICVFCGASPGSRPIYREAAKALGEAIAGRGWDLVWGGGRVGLMGTVADAALGAGGHAVGIIPGFLAQRELAHTSAEIRVVDSMHARKADMAARATAFVMLPGGFGTMDEFFEILTWAQLGIHNKPVGVLNVQGFFDPLIALAQHMVKEGFVRPDHLELLTVKHSADALLDAIAERAIMP
ncbi:TIGR00730 family Rossman fold protein [Uliginosibacterium sp. sgz301328]|uniref:LOG family protein n=1 Tax=Uliginosibacterium sp. sgz301328 TaxID=3243764 RepID=UPI00359D22C1